MLDMTTTNDWDFPVEMQPLYTEEGVRAENALALTRTDTNTILGVHSPRYQIVTNDDIINKTMDAIVEADISKDYEAKFEVFDGGKRLRGEVLFPDINIEPVVGDYSSFRIEFFTSYDASWPYSNIAQAFRWWCANGCTTPDTFSYSRQKHTKNIHIDADHEKMKLSVEDFLGLESKWKEWMGVIVPDNSVEYLFGKTLAKVHSYTSKPKKNETQLEKLMKQWTEEKRKLGGNKWALYNTMTAWATHTEGLASPEKSRRNRQAQVSQAMKHDLFTSM